MAWRIFNSLPVVILFVLVSAVTVYIAYQEAIDNETQRTVLESQWIDEIGSSKCGAYTKYGSVNYDLVNKEMLCRQVLTNQIRDNCALERDHWFSLFSTMSEGTKYRDCMLHMKVNL